MGNESVTVALNWRERQTNLSTGEKTISNNLFVFCFERCENLILIYVCRICRKK